MLNINGIEWLHKVGCYHTTLERDPLLVLEFCRKGQISWAGGALPCNQLKAGEMLVYDAWTSGALTRSADYCGDRILFFEESIKYIREHFAGFLISYIHHTVLQLSDLQIPFRLQNLISPF